MHLKTKWRIFSSITKNRLAYWNLNTLFDFLRQFASGYVNFYFFFLSVDDFQKAYKHAKFWFECAAWFAGKVERKHEVHLALQWTIKFPWSEGFILWKTTSPIECAGIPDLFQCITAWNSRASFFSLSVSLSLFNILFSNKLQTFKWKNKTKHRFKTFAT